MSNKLYIGNLPFETTADHLFELFNTCGKVLSVHVPIDNETHRQRGFAFVEMDSQEAVIKAINQIDGAMVGGRNIKVTPAIEKPISTAPHTNRPFAKFVENGKCVLCGDTDDLYGFYPGTGVCPKCIYSLSKASRSLKKF